MLFETAQRVGVVVVLAVVLVYVWSLEGRGRWRAVLTDRLVYGVPWGTLITVAGVILVYLFVQSGIESWADPVVTPFRSWSYSYVLGMLAAGFTHAGPDHLVGNVLAALVLTPLVEYAWGHYPVGNSSPDSGSEHAPPAEPLETDPSAADEPGNGRGLLARPATRAVVVFPFTIVGVSLLTSVLARGWSLGYSGTVFFLLGVAVVVLPLATVVGMVALSGVNVLFRALQTPVLRVTASPGPSGPPPWAGVNVQAHLLGFLLGVLVAFVVLRSRDRWPDPGRLALAVVLVVLVRNLWAYSTSSGGTFTRWQGIGVIFALFLAALVVAMVATDNSVTAGPVALRSVVVGGLVVIALILALSSVQPNGVPMDDDPVPEGSAIDIADYTITYAEDTPHGRISTNSSGVIVVSERRSVWTSVVQPDRLAHSGSATATVGGVGWRAVVGVERSGWTVAGNDTVYTVSLEHGDRTVQVFRSEPRRADGLLAGQAFSVVPSADGFQLRITRENETVGKTTLPAANESRTVELDDRATLDELTVVAEEQDDTLRVAVEHGNTSLPVAETEEYS